MKFPTFLVTWHYFCNSSAKGHKHLEMLCVLGVHFTELSTVMRPDVNDSWTGQKRKISPDGRKETRCECSIINANSVMKGVVGGGVWQILSRVKSRVSWQKVGSSWQKVGNLISTALGIGERWNNLATKTWRHAFWSQTFIGKRCNF